MPRKPLADAAERRRSQNAEAQRVYRAKQKQRVKTLEKVAISALLSKNAPSRKDSGETPSSSQRLPPDPPVGIAATEIYQYLTLTTMQESSKCLKLVAAEDFTFRDIVKYGLISMGCAISPDLFASALSISPRRWIEILKWTYPNVDMRQAVSFGVRVLAQLNGPEDWPTLEWLTQPSADLYANRITLTATSYFKALFANANHLKVSPDVVMEDDARSKFYVSDLENGEHSRDDNTRDIPPDLAPTSVQLSVPHHPIADLIPWPSFRSKYILAMSVDPPMIDEPDLCLDVMGGGLRCWGSTMGSMNGRGQGAPWDSRSWEAAPWFLEKWVGLVGGPDSDISRTSAWWRAMEGTDNNIGEWSH